MLKLITREGCELCDKAKDLLKRLDIEYKELYIGLDIWREDVKMKYPTQKLLPVVLDDDKLIGGFEELKELLMIDTLAIKDEQIQELKEHLSKLLRSGKVAVKFEKVDGTIRDMVCTTSEQYIPENILEEQREAKPRKENPNIQRVWDLEKEAWRGFRLDSIISYGAA